MAFDQLKTERLTIRRLRKGDAQYFASYRSVPEVARFQTAYSGSKAETFVNEMATSDPSVTGKWFQFAIELTSESHLIGDIGFLNLDKDQKCWVGFTLAPKYWRKGYATEAVRAVIAYYLKLGITSVWASTDPKNEASMRVLRGLGFSLMEAKPDDMLFRLET